jgi:hypothetical protein
MNTLEKWCSKYRCQVCKKEYENENDAKSCVISHLVDIELEIDQMYDRINDKNKINIIKSFITKKIGHQITSLNIIDNFIEMNIYEHGIYWEQVNQIINRIKMIGEVIDISMLYSEKLKYSYINLDIKIKINENEVDDFIDRFGD